jgi:hypothetical protein
MSFALFAFIKYLYLFCSAGITSSSNLESVPIICPFSLSCIHYCTLKPKKEKENASISIVKKMKHRPFTKITIFHLIETWKCFIFIQEL